MFLTVESTLGDASDAALMANCHLAKRIPCTCEFDARKKSDARSTYSVRRALHTRRRSWQEPAFLRGSSSDSRYSRRTAGSRCYRVAIERQCERSTECIVERLRKNLLGSRRLTSRHGHNIGMNTAQETRDHPVSPLCFISFPSSTCSPPLASPLPHSPFPPPSPTLHPPLPSSLPSLPPLSPPLHHNPPHSSPLLPGETARSLPLTEEVSSDLAKEVPLRKNLFENDVSRYEHNIAQHYDEYQHKNTTVNPRKTT